MCVPGLALFCNFGTGLLCKCINLIPFMYWPNYCQMVLRIIISGKYTVPGHVCLYLHVREHMRSCGKYQTCISIYINVTPIHTFFRLPSTYSTVTRLCFIRVPLLYCVYGIFGIFLPIIHFSASLPFLSALFYHTYYHFWEGGEGREKH